MFELLVKEKTFVDVGPLWVLENEKVSLAHKCGSSQVTAIDQFPLTHELWEKFKTHMKLSKIQCEIISADICDVNKTFDIVHCAGVLYHHPSPIFMLQKLYQMCNEYLVLGTTITNSLVSNSFGSIDILPGSSVFLPALPEFQLNVVRRDWEQFLCGKAGDIMSHDVVWDSKNLYHWWWLFTYEAVIAMCQVVGFSVIKENRTDRILTLLLKK